MTFTPADGFSLAVFCLVLAFVGSALLLGTFRAAKRLKSPAASETMKTGLALAAGVAICGILAESGILASHPMPLVPVFLFFTIAGSILFGLSRSGLRLALGLPLPALVGFQGFRLVLELVLHAWSVRGTIPVTMTWNGENFDIFSGVLALILAPLAARSKAACWIANITGFALLLNVMRVAVLSSPLPFAWHVDPPLQLIFHFPYILIVPVCIGGALAGHLILTRRLRAG